MVILCVLHHAGWHQQLGRAQLAAAQHQDVQVSDIDEWLA
jgi:hypothetical protein